MPASCARAVAARLGYYLPKYNNWRKAAALLLPGILADLPKLGGSPVEVWLEFVCQGRRSRPDRTQGRR